MNSSPRRLNLYNLQLSGEKMRKLQLREEQKKGLESQLKHQTAQRLINDTVLRNEMKWNSNVSAENLQELDAQKQK